jgi:hypothetical protein
LVLGSQPESQVTWLAGRVGVGVYFNPFVQWRDKVLHFDMYPVFDGILVCLG